MRVPSDMPMGHLRRIARRIRARHLDQPEQLTRRRRRLDEPVVVERRRQRIRDAMAAR